LLFPSFSPAFAPDEFPEYSGEGPDIIGVPHSGEIKGSYKTTSGNGTITGQSTL